ncbi:MAG: hypothetical protein ACFE0O_13875 [Opitutales bacterium]
MPGPSPASDPKEPVGVRPDRQIPVFGAIREVSGHILNVVTGLPGSATPLLMRMLETGGLLALEEAGPNFTTPPIYHGILEWEAIHGLNRRSPLLERARSRVINLPCSLVHQLPWNHRYRILFLRHPVELLADGRAAEAYPRSERNRASNRQADTLRNHERELLELFRAHSHFQLLEIPYEGLIDDPEAWASLITEYLGPDLLPHAERMPAVVEDAAGAD